MTSNPCQHSVHNFVYKNAECAMSFSVSDMTSLSKYRANRTALAGKARAGAEKIFTKSDNSHIAIISAQLLDYQHPLECERIHLLSIDEAKCGLADMATSRFLKRDTALDQLQQRRKTAAKPSDSVNSGKLPAKKGGRLAGPGRSDRELPGAHGWH
jgi:hypothetical protein